MSQLKYVEGRYVFILQERRKYHVKKFDCVRNCAVGMSLIIEPVHIQDNWLYRNLPFWKLWYFTQLIGVNVQNKYLLKYGMSKL